PVGDWARTATTVKIATITTWIASARPRSILTMKSQSSVPNEGANMSLPDVCAYDRTSFASANAVHNPDEMAPTFSIGIQARESRGTATASKTNAPKASACASCTPVETVGRPHRTTTPGSITSVGFAAPENQAAITTPTKAAGIADHKAVRRETRPTADWVASVSVILPAYGALKPVKTAVRGLIGWCSLVRCCIRRARCDIRCAGRCWGVVLNECRRMCDKRNNFGRRPSAL